MAFILLRDENCSNTSNLEVNAGRILRNHLQMQEEALSEHVVVKHCMILIWGLYCNRSEQDHFKWGWMSEYVVVFMRLRLSAAHTHTHTHWSRSGQNISLIYWSDTTVNQVMLQNDSKSLNDENNRLIITCFPSVLFLVSCGVADSSVSWCLVLE